MSDRISVDRGSIDDRLAVMTKDVDAIGRSLTPVPAAPNAGRASALIAGISAAAADAAALGADCETALVLITKDVLDEWAGSEAAAVRELDGLADELSAR